MRKSSKMSRFVLDTGVLIEYIVKGAPYRENIVNLFEESARGSVKLYISPITLSETLYVASRVYKTSGISNPNEEAINFVKWVEARAQLVDMSEELALRAGELKKELRIALPDCFVIAAAQIIGAKPLFRKVEEEMKPIEGKLKGMGVKFLSSL